MRSVPPLAALALAATVLLTGCVPQDPAIDPPPEPTSEPVFASDEEALTAATDAYKAYLAMSDLIAREGGKDPERIAPYVTEEWLEHSVQFFNSLSASNRHQVGNSSLHSAQLQQHSYEQDGDAFVVIYVCIDYATVEILDEDNVDSIPADSPTLLPIEATLETEDGAFRLSGNEPWTSVTFC